jgi:hypothetical protein
MSFQKDLAPVLLPGLANADVALGLLDGGMTPALSVESWSI